ncbi:MAG: WG repeat-containing protein [Myxococcota bacterium]
MLGGASRSCFSVAWMCGSALACGGPTVTAGAEPRGSQARAAATAPSESKGKEAADEGAEGALVLARVSVSEGSGYIDLEGAWVLPPKYTLAYPFLGGLAGVLEDAPRVDTDRGPGFLDGENHLIQPDGGRASVSFARGVWDGVALVRYEPDGKRTIIELDGSVVASFDQIDVFREGLAVAVRGDQQGWVRPDGSWARTMPWTGKPRLSAVSEGRASVINAHDDRCRWMNPETGAWVLPGEFASCGAFAEGRAFARMPGDDRFGIIDSEGRWLVRNAFDDYLDYREGCGMVAIGDRWGMVDRNGSWVVRPRWKGTGRMSEGRVLIADDQGQIGYANTRGQVVIDPVFAQGGWFHHGRAVVQPEPGGPVGFIDPSGAVVVALKFKTADGFSEVNGLRIGW